MRQYVWIFNDMKTALKTLGYLYIKILQLYVNNATLSDCIKLLTCLLHGRIGCTNGSNQKRIIITFMTRKPLLSDTENQPEKKLFGRGRSRSRCQNMVSAMKDSIFLFFEEEKNGTLGSPISWSIYRSFLILTTFFLNPGKNVQWKKCYEETLSSQHILCRG